MTRNEVIDRLETLAASKTIIRENKVALEEAVKAVSEQQRMDDIISRLNDELIRGAGLIGCYGEIKNIKAYLSGVIFACRLILGKDPKSVLPTDEEIRKVIEDGEKETRG